MRWGGGGCGGWLGGVPVLVLWECQRNWRLVDVGVSQMCNSGPPPDTVFTHEVHGPDTGAAAPALTPTPAAARSA